VGWSFALLVDQLSTVLSELMFGIGVVSPFSPVIDEYVAALYTADDNVMQDMWDI